MIIEELKYTPGKTVIKFRDDLADPHLKTAIVKALGEIDRSHIIAAGEHVVQEQRRAYAEALVEEENQGKLDFEGETSEEQEEPEEQAEGYTAEQAESEGVPVEFDEADDWEQKHVPYVPNTPIPDFRSMLKEHACWLIDNRYDDDEDESPYGLEELKQDMHYHGWKINQRTLETAKKRAKEMILGQ